MAETLNESSCACEPCAGTDNYVGSCNCDPCQNVAESNFAAYNGCDVYSPYILEQVHREALELEDEEDRVVNALGVNAVKTVNNAVNYQYSDNYESNGTFVSKNGNIDYSIDSTTVSENPPAVMNDMARFLGALWRQDSGKTVSSIIYKDNTYLWDKEGTLIGSNWKLDGTGDTLVSVIVSNLATSFNASGEGKVVLVLNGTDTITLSAVVSA